MSKKKYQSTEVTMFRRRAIAYLVSRGARFITCPSSNLLVSLLLNDDWIPASVKESLSAGKKTRNGAFITFFDLLPRDQRPKIKGRPKKKTDTSPFYDSDDWKRLRYRALQHYGAKCMCCGATAKDGATIHVDHIKPRSKFPDLELEFSNLQILCKICNLGKSNIDATDWR
jgi:HNH endonuclease